MTNPVLSVEARKWSRIEKYVGLSGLIEGVMGKKMGLKEEFRKPTPFMAGITGNCGIRASERSVVPGLLMYFGRIIGFRKVCIWPPEKISLFQFSC